MKDLLKQLKNIAKIIKAIWEFMSSIIDGFISMMDSLSTVLESVFSYETVLPGVLFILVTSSVTLIIVKLIVGR